jgi:hypothetical protein
MIKIHILCSITDPPPENCAVYAITRKNVAEPDRPRITAHTHGIVRL